VFDPDGSKGRSIQQALALPKQRGEKLLDNELQAKAAIKRARSRTSNRVEEQLDLFNGVAA